MSSSQVSASSSSSTALVIPRKYYGRNEIISINSPTYKQTIDSILSVTQDISSTVASRTSSNHREQWVELNSSLEQLLSNLMDDSYIIEKFRYEAINEVIIPYVNEMKSPRMTLDKQRFDQVKNLIMLVNHGLTVYSGDSNELVFSPSHPANLLYSIDRLIDNINNQSNSLFSWKSKLSTLLKTFSNKQWQPILLDTQVGLRSMGGNLICLGMVEVVGRPVVMLYPLYLVAMEGLKLTNEIEVRGRITPDIIIRVIKIVALLLIGFQLITILSMYAGLGYSCLLIGGVAVTLAASDELTKTIAPVMAPHLFNLDMIFYRLQRAEVMAMNALNGNTSMINRHPSSPSRITRIISRESVTAANSQPFNGTPTSRFDTSSSSCTVDGKPKQE